MSTNSDAADGTRGATDPNVLTESHPTVARSLRQERTTRQQLIDECRATIHRRTGASRPAAAGPEHIASPLDRLMLIILDRAEKAGDPHEPSAPGRAA
jgi:hypothetical protein